MPGKPRNPQGEPLGVTAPSSCPWGQEMPTPGDIAYLPPLPLTSGPRVLLGAMVDPRYQPPTPWEGGSLTLWGSLDSLKPPRGQASPNNDFTTKGFFLQKKKEKQVVIFFLIKKPQTINKCICLYNKWIYLQENQIVFSFNSFPALNCENKQKKWGGVGGLKI